MSRRNFLNGFMGLVVAGSLLGGASAGAWAEQRAASALDGLDVPIGRVLHPSPASPLANRGWAPQAEAQLAALGVEL